MKQFNFQILLFVWVFISQGQVLFAQPNYDRVVLTQQLHNFLEGASNNNQEVHDAFWADDLIYTSSTGKRFGKAHIMAGFEKPEAISNTPKTSYTAQDIQINIYDNVAVVAFKMKGVTEGEVQFYYNSGTFLKRNGQWQVINWQATKIPNL